MKCCVPLCNTGENHSITVPGHDGQERITFNRFPTTAVQRAAWLQMLGLTESDLPPGAAVCSEHFRRSDFTVTNDGIIKLNKDSIPLQFCMMCLASGHSKMYPMSQNYLEKAYTSLTGIAVSHIHDQINTQPRVCVECAQRLVNCDRFRNKGLRAFKLLMQILGNGKVLTLHNLKSINRVEKQLISNIAKHTFEPDHCDLYVKCNEEDNKIYSEEDYNSSDTKGNFDMTRVKYEEKGATDFNVVHLSETDNFQNDVHADNDIINDNKLYNDDIKIPGILNYDAQVKNTNFNNDDNTNYCDDVLTDNVAQAINEDKFDDDIIMNSDVVNVTNNDDIVFMICDDDDDDVKSLKDDIAHDIDGDVEDGFADNMNNYHNNGLLSKNYVKLFNRFKDENKSENRVLNNLKQEIAKSKNKKRPSVLAPKKNGRQLSSESKIVKASVAKRKRRKKPKPCIPKPKKQNSVAKLFTKTILTYEEQLADIQRRQHTELYKSYPYKCDICFTGRWSFFTYNRHMDKHTDKHGKWECAICGLRKETRKRLRSHVLSHAERYSCKRCKYVTSFSALLKPHAQSHSGQAFKCPHCETVFSKKSSYFSHVRIKHPSDLACPLCGFSFVSENGVKTHIKLSHPCEDVRNLSGPSCAQCNVRFASEAAYDTHISVSPKHVSCGIPKRNECTENNKPVQKRQYRPRYDKIDAALCETCGKSFQCASFLKKHMEVHTGLKPYKCDICSKSYLRRYSLTSHIQSTHGDNPKRFPCSVCHREFSFYRNRERHMLTHNPTKRTTRYTCDICNKSFTTRDAKLQHLRYVHGNMPRPRPKTNRPQRRARKQKYSEDNSDSHDASDV